MTERVPFMTLAPRSDAAAIRAAIDRVIDRGWFILGPELTAFEEEFAAASGARFAVGVGTGTDAIALTLRALGIGPGDEVITSPLSAAFSALAITMAGATPVFADIDASRLTLDPNAAAAAITSRTAGILPVHLYGQPADMPAFTALASRHGLALIEDACQAHLATSAAHAVGTFGAAGAFSFYPTKNLGALGDAGAAVTDDAALADRIRRLRNGGQAERYDHKTFGVNSRLDEMQAAILRARLPDLRGWTARRRELAARYRRDLAGAPFTVPSEHESGHVYHLFPVLVADRAAFQRHMADEGIGTLVHYPIALPDQDAFRSSPASDCPIARRVAAEVCSLPLHPFLSDPEADLVSAAARGWAPATVRRS